MRWLAATQRDALLYAARSLSRSARGADATGEPRWCAAHRGCATPTSPISEVARTMIAESRWAILVRAPDGLTGP